MKGKLNGEKRAFDYLNKSQEVLYQREFKRANNIYQQHSQKGNRS